MAVILSIDSLSVAHDEQELAANPMETIR